MSAFTDFVSQAWFIGLSCFFVGLALGALIDPQ